ncbi:MAG: phosphonate transport system substrate-binding protein [Alphaproteobacteria bacterium]|jgi:phosphonate transport system substrate-binding protein
MNILKLGFVALLAGIGACAVVWGPLAREVEAAEPRAVAKDAPIPRQQVLVVARVSRRVARHQPRVEAFADWLASQMAHVGIRAGEGHIARSPKEMIDLLRAGRVDVVSESVLTALSYEDKAGAEILFHEWRSQRPYYQTVFITSRATKFFSLNDLRGRRIAFEDRGSTSGYLIAYGNTD